VSTVHSFWLHLIWKVFYSLIYSRFAIYIHEKNENENRESPLHEHFEKSLEFLRSQRFCKNVGPVILRLYFDKFNVTLANLIMKMVPLYGDVFSALLNALAVGKHDA
jgi:hypothetical protein